MNGVIYNFIDNETEISEKINTLDKVANLYLMRIRDLYVEDLFFMSAIDKSIKLIDSFLFALEKKNITILATLTRMQMDCLLRTYASTLVNDSTAFCESVLFKKIEINQIKDKNNNKMTDRYLCESLGQYLNLPIYDSYKKICGFVHFSSESFYNIAKTSDKSDISLFVSRNNRKEDEKYYKRISIKLANQFYYFGSFLVEVLFASWLEQKGDLKE
ncbi:MAG: hypothetical protein NC091_12555 [Bacteroides sp.]|nr:hypothetical protein [Bacteroides sp.]